MSHLFTPFKLRDLVVPNRIVISPMCQYSADHGKATAWHMIHLGSLALSGAGLLIMEATAVEPEGRITAGDLGLWDDATEQALVPLLAAIRAYSKIPLVMQIGHAGRKASRSVPWLGDEFVSPALPTGWQPVAPSAIPHKEGQLAPVALDQAGINRIIAAFVATAQRAERLGVDGLEIHAAHGYLLHTFLSPLANQRTDQYGGNLENRLRLILEIFTAVRAVFPAHKPVGVRVSASDWADSGGWTLEETLVLAQRLKDLGVDWIDASSGGLLTHQKIPQEAGYQVPFAEAIKTATGLPTMAVGLITEPAHAEAIIASGQADFVALARAMLYDPHWPWHAAAALGATVDAPPQYWRSRPNGVAALFNPAN